MLMGSSSKIQYIESDFNIFYDDGLLNDVKYEKLLGITIDNCVSWCQQINNIVYTIPVLFPYLHST
jgi:predicted HAD superfamily hydrolase